MIPQFLTQHFLPLELWIMISKLIFIDRQRQLRSLLYFPTTVKLPSGRSFHYTLFFSWSIQPRHIAFRCYGVLIIWSKVPLEFQERYGAWISTDNECSSTCVRTDSCCHGTQSFKDSFLTRFYSF